jgi:hypothetical protein
VPRTLEFAHERDREIVDRDEAASRIVDQELIASGSMPPRPLARYDLRRRTQIRLIDADGTQELQRDRCLVRLSLMRALPD